MRVINYSACCERRQYIPAVVRVVQFSIVGAVILYDNVILSAENVYPRLSHGHAGKKRTRRHTRHYEKISLPPPHTHTHVQTYSHSCHFEL